MAERVEITTTASSRLEEDTMLVLVICNRMGHDCEEDSCRDDRGWRTAANIIIKGRKKHTSIHEMY